MFEGLRNAFYSFLFNIGRFGAYIVYIDLYLFYSPKA